MTCIELEKEIEQLTMAVFDVNLYGSRAGNKTFTVSFTWPVQMRIRWGEHEFKLTACEIAEIVVNRYQQYCNKRLFKETDHGKKKARYTRQHVERL